MAQTYTVKPLTASTTFIDANWDKSQWRKAKPLDIGLFMGQKPQRFLVPGEVMELEIQGLGTQKQTTQAYKD